MRGYSYQLSAGSRPGPLGGWDEPTALCWRIPRDRLKKTGDLQTGQCFCFRAPAGSRINLLNPDPSSHWPWETTIWIHADFHARFLAIPQVWPQLKDGTMVACRAPIKYPEKLYNSGNAAPMTCGRTASAKDARALGWLKANGTGEWRCPNCDAFYATCMPCTEMVQNPQTASVQLLERRRHTI